MSARRFAENGIIPIAESAGGGCPGRIEICVRNVLPIELRRICATPPVPVIPMCDEQIGNDRVRRRRNLHGENLCLHSLQSGAKDKSSTERLCCAREGRFHCGQQYAAAPFQKVRASAFQTT